MREENKLKKIRNIAVFSDNDKQRILLADKMLSYMGYEDYDNKSMDWMECERDIDLVIVDPVIRESWLGREINVIRFDSLFESHTMREILR